MLANYVRPWLQSRFIDPFIRFSYIKTLTPLWVTMGATFSGVFSAICIACGLPLFAMMSLFISGCLDVLDGSIARKYQKASPFGAVCDIFSDRLVECAVIVGLFFLHPETRAVYCLAMLSACFLCVTSFLVVGIFIENTQEKSFHYSPGIIERGEAFLFFFLMIAFPTWFWQLSCVFTGLVFLTACIRIYQFGKNSIL